ncbi:TPA: hypothetical protein QHN36_003568 [Enterobacter bugandensis]|nr:hypothetical protein [Enterobacter bugandensis]
MTTETKAVLAFTSPEMKVFTYDGATLAVFRGVHPRKGPGMEMKIVDGNAPQKVNSDGIRINFVTGGNYAPAMQRLHVDAEREGIMLEDRTQHDAIDWQRVQDLGDNVITKMIAEFDEEDAANEVNAFREEKPTDLRNGDELADLLGQILGVKH